ncbi:MAG TPA: hypothetical protein VK281_12825 [Xanthobacteraceae bacterium]|nr:hypothetical protein [Xanthobacteraceae bacterium]
MTGPTVRAAAGPSPRPDLAALPRYPSLIEINTRVWLRGLSQRAGRPVTLADMTPPSMGSRTEASVGSGS